MSLLVGILVALLGAALLIIVTLCVFLVAVPAIVFLFVILLTIADNSDVIEEQK